jgi:hypothetical protein
MPACFPRAALLAAPAVYLAACGGGARIVTPGDGLQGAAPSAVVRATEPPPASRVPDASLGGGAEGAGDTISSGAPTSEPSPSSQASLEGRDRQFEILNEAVSALRQEASRSYQRASDLARETERLRTLIASLQRRLAKNRKENRDLVDHVRELEERLQEVRTPPPEATEGARPSEPPPVSRTPLGPTPPPQSPAPEPDAGRSPTEPAGGDEVVPPAP